MDEQHPIRDSARSTKTESNDETNWSESSHTYYYSKFQLFQDNQEINQFYRYSVFLSKLCEELGQQWRSEASALFYPYFNSQDVFMNLLCTWLQMHSINTVYQNPISKPTPPVFNTTLVDQFVAKIKRLYEDQFKEKKGDLKISLPSTKAICMGFVITANEIWDQMFRTEQKNTRKGFSLFKGVTTKIQNFQPLMVVTQKISNLFGRKKVKLDNSIHAITAQSDQMFGDCYIEFRKTMGLEKELERKMSEFNLNDVDNESPKDIKEMKKIVTKDEFKQSDSPLEKNLLGNVYSYITRYLKKKHPWQVASSFVTNILEINQQSIQEGTKVKVLKPAEDFYEKLIIGWLMITKCSPDHNVTFETYLSQVKLSFGKSWKDKYNVPTKYFYERLIKHWNDIQKQTSGFSLSEKDLLNGLIIKIRQSMREDWQRKIKMQKKKSSNSNQK